MKIAVEGCCHGSLDATYNQIAFLEKQKKYNVDLLLIGGDFQAVRNHSDLTCMAVPQKFRQVGEFYKYYTGQKLAPILTIVIGGNHEASNYLWELYHGGWLAPNIYYLGCAGSIKVNGIRIAGASGIYKSHDYSRGHYEKLPYDSSQLRSIYHIREYEVSKLVQLPSPDIFMSHDWPQAIEQHGDLQGLLKRKPFFQKDIETGQLGSPPLMQLLRALRPKRWFSAHLHVKFEATFSHVAPTEGPSVNPDEIVIEDDEFDDAPGPSSAPAKNPDEVIIEDEDDRAPSSKSAGAENAPSESAPVSGNVETYFLALDKCLPKRQYLEVVDMSAPDDPEAVNPDEALPTSFGRQELSSRAPPPKLTYDPEWLAITRAFHPFLSLSRTQTKLPPPEAAKKMIEQELQWVHANVGERPIDEVQHFVMTAPGPAPGGRQHLPMWYTNPQTEAFCDMLQIENKINAVPVNVPAATT